MDNLQKLMPDYPRTKHLPYKPNATRDDLIADPKEVLDLFESENVYFEEKIDGSQCGICYYKDHPVIRNRSSFLNKGYLKRTPAKMQFASIWNWFYENRDKFEKLNAALGFPGAIYGEWTVALHGIRYDNLPNYFFAFDIYDHQTGCFMDTGFARKVLEDAGFIIPPLLKKGRIDKWEELDVFMEDNSPFSSLDKREGIYVKVTDGEQVTKRFKMVRHDFIQGCHWSKKQLRKNTLA